MLSDQIGHLSQLERYVSATKSALSFYKATYTETAFFYLDYILPRCSPDDAGKYKVVAKSALGQATTFATLVVNCESPAFVSSQSLQRQSGVNSFSHC